MIAAVLGIIALAALLLDLRALFLGALSVALSFVAAVIVLDALGYTLNALVILGLLVASAVVVDDAVGATIVILDRVRLRREQNLHVPLQTVIVEGMVELRGTLGYGTLIVLLAIAPVFFAKGLTATYLHPMALAFALAVIASTLVVTLLTPGDRNDAVRSWTGPRAWGAAQARGSRALRPVSSSAGCGSRAALCSRCACSGSPRRSRSRSSTSRRRRASRIATSSSPGPGRPAPAFRR